MPPVRHCEQFESICGRVAQPVALPKIFAGFAGLDRYPHKVAVSQTANSGLLFKFTKVTVLGSIPDNPLILLSSGLLKISNLPLILVTLDKPLRFNRLLLL